MVESSEGADIAVGAPALGTCDPALIGAGAGRIKGRDRVHGRTSGLERMGLGRARRCSSRSARICPSPTVGPGTI